MACTIPLLAACTAWRPHDAVQAQPPGPAAPALAETEGRVASGDPPAPVSSSAPYAGTSPDDVAVLVNKTHGLPADYAPDDLIEPDVPFIFAEKHERRLLRQVAAGALEELFAAAREDGVYLAGVSGYRSQATQQALFEYYVQRDGAEKARMFSAEPRHSEHETGLAMDVSGSTGQCAAEDCFAGTPEAAWLARRAHEYGYIVRYPKGKEDITGYKYEPWHLRYVGPEMARVLAERGITLEEYYAETPPAAAG